MRRAAKIDSNQKTIVKSLRQIPGISVHTLGGTIDICVGYRGVNYLIEVKGSKDTEIRPSQKKFFREWKGQVSYAYNLEQVLKILGL